jgi:hypothetical protein
MACAPALPLAVADKDSALIADPPVDSGEPSSIDTGEGEPDSGVAPRPDPDPIEDLGGFVWERPAVLMLDVRGRYIPDDDKITATLEVIRDHDGTLSDLDDAPRAYTGAIGIEGHGSSSSGFPKRGYRIEIRDEEGEDLNYPLLDLPADSDWVLHGPYSDKTLIRNALAYELARDMAVWTGQWQPRTAWAELFIDGYYQGVYLLVERIKIDQNRVDVPETTDEDGDLSGGYIVKVDQLRSEGFVTTAGTPIDYHDPKYENLSEEQLEYLSDWFDSMESNMMGTSWRDETEGYSSFIEPDSFIDHYILNELAHNVDGLRLSAYLVKDPDSMGGRLHAGPAWDFNLGFGNADYCEGWSPEGFLQDAACGDVLQVPFWWRRLPEDPAWRDRTRCRWEELRGDLLSDARLLERVDRLAGEVSAMEGRDHDTWDNIGVYVWPNAYVGATWNDEVAWMSAWLLDRALWLDGHLPGTCSDPGLLLPGVP